MILRGIFATWIGLRGCWDSRFSFSADFCKILHAEIHRKLASDAKYLLFCVEIGLFWWFLCIVFLRKALNSALLKQQVVVDPSILTLGPLAANRSWRYTQRRHVGPIDMEKVVRAGSLTHVHITRALGIYDHPAFIPRMFHSVVFLSTSTLVHSGLLHFFLFLFSFLFVLVLLDCAATLAPCPAQAQSSLSSIGGKDRGRLVLPRLSTDLWKFLTWQSSQWLLAIHCLFFVTL